ncbi:MAG TPA: hypothetical protein DEA55_00055 [Rhodospirillaceae bacterium]|nr:hypothetical protein [Rhodospirillaceae bacterium]
MVDFVNIWIAAGIVSWVLWKARRWYIIAAGWAGAALITSLLLRLHFAYTLDSYILPPLTLTPMLVAASFVSIALAELAVRRTGARFKVLLVSLLAPAVLATLPALFMNGFFHGNIFLGIIILFTATLPAVQKALALFVGLCARNNDEVI